MLGCCLWSCSSPPAPTAPERTPEADAGDDQTVASGELVTLDGSGSSDPLQRPLTYRWEPGGSNPGSVGALPPDAVVRINPPRAGAYWFFLTVTAANQVSAADSVLVSVVGEDNSPPVADAGPDLGFPLDAIIFLDASTSSDADGDSLAFVWRLVSGTGTVSLLDSTAAQTSFTATDTGSYVFRVRVSDLLSTSTDEVRIDLTAADNVRPIAVAGRDTAITVGTTLTLDGSASTDPDGDDEALSYRWTVSGPAGVDARLTDPTGATPSFTPDTEGEYVISLTVADADGLESLRNQFGVDVRALVYEKRGGMIEIPGGPFTMGSDDGLADEKPPHTVVMSTFWFDEFEVTAAQYQVCVDAGGCEDAGRDPGCNGGTTGFGEHPINCVDWAQADAFCGWAGKRLPSEAEWEKAARGTDERAFPWGHTPPQTGLLNYNDLYGATVEVGAFPDGVSFFGVHDMAGNVQEWTADFYAADYYATSPARDPQGPAEGDRRVVRGGHWKLKINVGFHLFSTTARANFNVDNREPTIGFRCARNDPP